MGKEDMESAVAVNFLYEVLLKKPELQLKPKHSRDRTHILLFFVGPKAKELYVIRNIKSTRILIEHPLTVALSGVHPDQNASPYQGGTVKNAAVGRRISINRQHTVYVDSTEALSKLIAWYANSDGAGNTLGSDGDQSTEPSGLSSIPLAELQQAQSTGSGSDIVEDSILPLPIDTTQAHVISASAQARLESDTPGLQTAEREAVVKVRFGQGNFRQALFEENGYGEICWMSGIAGGRLLIASHIKPWSHCANDTDSRGRTDNGLLLSALWDAAFDAGLLSFDPDWNVVVSSKLSESARYALNLEAHPTLPDVFRTDGRKEYLAYHHAEVFEHWNKEST